MTQPMFSIIIPGCNIEKQINRCLASVRRQTFTDYEVLAIDDGSTDNTGRLMDRWKGRFGNRLTVIHQENRGPGSARNAGIRQASGQYLVFVDGDDYVSPDLLETLAGILAVQYYDVVVYNGNEVDDRGHVRPMRYCGDFSGEIHPPEEKSCIHVYGGVWNKAVRRSFYQLHHFSFPEGVWYEDAGISRLWLMSARKIWFCQDRLYQYYQRPRSIMHSQVNARMLDILPVCRDFRRETRRLGLDKAFKDEIVFSILVLVLIQTGGREINSRNPLSPMQDHLCRYIMKLYGGIPENPYITPPVRRRMECFLHGEYLRYYLRYQAAPALKGLLIRERF